jgi:predicted Rossmann-fold nucleotide-binding protein
MDLLDKAIDEFGGPKLSEVGTIDELEQALGMYVLGRHVGWKVLVLVHNKRTIRKYEEILGISIREAFPEEAAASDRSLGYRFAKTLSNFWKAVSGEIPVPDRRKIE